MKVFNLSCRFISILHEVVLKSLPDLFVNVLFSPTVDSNLLLQTSSLSCLSQSGLSVIDVDTNCSEWGDVRPDWKLIELNRIQL